MGKLDEKKKIKQEALLSSAFKLFTEKGINNTSIADIASSAKLAKGTFYLYFKDKYDIRDRLITKHGNRLFENLSWAIFANIRIAGKDNMNCMDIFEELINKSGRSFKDKDLMIFMIVELVNSTCYSAVIYKSPVALEELKPALYETIRGIIAQFETTVPVGV